MVILTRRTALGFGAAASLHFATPVSARPARRATPAPEEVHHPTPTIDPAANPVLYWNNVSLDLVALDHSIDSALAAAPGPCASAWALGVIHAVIADAVSLAYRCTYRPQFYTGALPRVQVPPLFVGGAAAAIITRVFSSPVHAFSIGMSSQHFQRIIGGGDGDDWQNGVAFAESQHFREMWNKSEINQKVLPQMSNYIPRPRKHNIDPYNASQGFYGVYWGSQSPLVLTSDQVSTLAVPPPPPEGSPEYEHDLAEVSVIGALESRSSRQFAARTQAQTNTGLFWAYDGARLIGTPMRLYNQALRRIAVDDGLDVPAMARLFALCNIAMADASIVTWYGKYKYAVWRPVLGIQNHLTFPIPDWRPLGAPKTNPQRFEPGAAINARTAARTGGASSLAQRVRFSRTLNLDERGVRYDQDEDGYGQAAFTPNFPSYPSGHATIGAACFELLKIFRSARPQTAENPNAIDAVLVSDELNGVSIDNFRNEPRPLHRVHFATIDDMIKDNELSRIYLGVHWRFDQNRGTASGRRIAERVYRGAYRLGESVR